jgi:hypothetical protein
LIHHDSLDNDTIIIEERGCDEEATFLDNPGVIPPLFFIHHPMLCKTDEHPGASL